MTGALTWAFMFEGKRYFEGVRSLATNDIDKPILNLFRALSYTGEKRLPLTSSGAQDPREFEDMYGAGRPPEIDGIASMSGTSSVEVLLWSHHDDWDVQGETQVLLEIENLPFDTDKVRVKHFRIDREHSNAYTEWKRQGSPQEPTETQLRVIKSREGLELYESPHDVTLFGGRFRKEIVLPVHGLSLLVITPASSRL